MKSGSAQSIIFYLLASMMLILSGCSKSTKEAPPQPDIVFPVTFPKIVDSKLYSIDENRFFGLPADENQSSADEISLYDTLLLDITSGLFLALDIDLSDKTSEDGVDTFSNTALPEFIVYADETKHILRLYDLDTRHDHQLYSFEDDPLDQFLETALPEETTTEEKKPSFICDLQKVVTWDEEARLAKKVLFKDEFAVYVKTSTLENCGEPQEGFQYWQINIVESSETFTIRRKTLKTHSHEHRHFHDHDDPDYEFADIHNHEHPLEDGELDENNEKFNSKDHKHKHSHSHDFIFSFLHEHQELSQTELDAVHTDPVNQEITFETLPVYVGRKTTLTSIDEALMYSGQPIINLNARTFGYLGLNSKQQALKFFEVDLDSFEKRLLWSTQSDNLANLSNSTQKNTSWRALVPRYNRLVNYSIINNQVTIFADRNLFIFSFESLFDDDASEERDNSLDNPLFSSSYSPPSLRARAHYNESNHKMVITENNQLWLIDLNEELPAPVLIRTFSEDNLTSIEAKMMASEIMVIKHFTENDTERTSITSVQDNGLEVSTIESKTDDTIRVFNSGSNSFLNFRSSDPDQQLSAKLLLSDFGSPFPKLINSFWLSDALDYRSFLEQNIIVQFSSDFISTIPGTIEEPGIYILDFASTDGRGENISFDPSIAVSGASGLVKFNDMYTIIEYQNRDKETKALSVINAF